MTAAPHSDLVDVRVIGTAGAATAAYSRLVPLFESYRQSGPYPSRKNPDQVRFYVTGLLWPHTPALGDPCERGEWLCAALERVRESIATALADETADRQYALEQADASLASLIVRWRSSPGHAHIPSRRGGRPMSAAADRVCWVDLAWDRSNASDGVSRYGAYLRGHPELFDPLAGGPQGITEDPGEFAIAAFRVACGPIMSPGYVRWHPRVLDHQVDHGEDPDPSRLVVKVALATSLPLWLGSPWWSWTTYMGRDWSEPEDAKHAALARLELRWPVQVAALPKPRPPARQGVPNLADARASVRALVAEINRTAGPVLARLEGGERR